MLAVLVAILATAPAGPGAQLTSPCHLAILPLDLGALENLDQIPCVDPFPSCKKIIGDFEKECPDMSVYCFPCGCERALCSLKEQVWLIILPWEEL